MTPASSFGPVPIARVKVSIDDLRFRWMREHGTLHLPDYRAQNDFPQGDSLVGFRTFLSAPLRQHEELIGVLSARRMELRPFTPAQIKLLETFADQAVIAIENVRLFQELKESLEQQTATSEILGVIASSPTDLQPVLDAIAQRAARVCGSDDATIRLVEGDEMMLAAHFGTIPPPGPVRGSLQWRSVGNEALLERRTIHIPDLQAEAEKYPDSSHMRRGIRTFLVTPLLREETAIGVISIRRKEVKPFTDKQVALLETFASQAVIAIENVRLFKELQERNSELREALEHQTATSEVLGIISCSPTDVQPVLDAIVESAARVCGIDDVVLRLRDGDIWVPRAHFGSIPIRNVEMSIDASWLHFVRDQGTLHVPDVREESNGPTQGVINEWRTFLAAPLRQQGELVGTLSARRMEVRPFTQTQIKLLETFANQAVIALENVRLFQELKESLEQQTATSEILGVIASSPTEIQPVLNTIAENAGRICGTPDVSIIRVEENTYRIAAAYGSAPNWTAGETRPLDRGSVVGRAVVDRQTIHIHDVRAVEDDFWRVKNNAVQQGLRTMLAVPLLREGLAIGAIGIRRTEVRPFTEKQIALLKTFADQAVIAIENVRLFKEIQERNAELREALEHQTATAEVLGIISRSPTDVQPVLDAIVESAARVCGVDDVLLRLIEGDSLVMRAHIGSIPLGRAEISIDEPQVRWIREHGTLHIPDVRAQNDFPTVGSVRGRTFLAAPLRQHGELIGMLTARRTEVRPFTPAQIKLLETFADQAVIAIENVRLFQELKESLEQQTATSEILGVIASSPTDIRPVLDTIAENAARVCDSYDALIRLVEGDKLRLAAHHGPVEPGFGLEQSLTRDSVGGRAVIDRKLIHIEDLMAVAATEFPGAVSAVGRMGGHTVLAAPLLREGVAIGVIFIRRTEVQPFTDKQITLLKTFADQAVIAIENVRLFNELQSRNRDLTEALEQQTATGEVLRVIASSPTELQPVLDTVIANAVRLIGAEHGHIRQYDGEFLHGVAYCNVGAEEVTALQRVPVRPGRDTAPGCAFLERKPIHVPNVELWEFRPPPYRAGTILAVPMLREGTPIGTLSVWRKVVMPFTERQIELVTTFADQAVIAIENVRLFKELQDRNRDLTEALEQQTATSEILRVIASSPTDLQSTLDAVAESAARLCDSRDAFIWRRDNDQLRMAAVYGRRIVEGEELPPMDSTSLPGRAVVDGRTIHVEDLRTLEAEFPWAKEHGIRAGVRTSLVAPLLSKGIAIGAIHIRRREVRPFTDKQINLLETFADQAVIAIENVRLFQELQERNAELREALEHQTATAEVLGIISRSPTDVQPVLDAIVESATRVCGIDDVTLRLHEGDTMVVRAHFGPITVPTDRAEINIDDPRFLLDARAWVTPHSRREPAERLPNSEYQRLAHLFNRSPASARGTRWNAGRTSHRGTSLHAGADQAPRNLCRPSCDRD